MDKYVIAPPSGSTNNSVGAVDRKWKEGNFEKLPNWQEYLAESTGFGIVSGCAPSISGLTVTVAAGVVHLADGTRKELSATNITLDNADSSNPRIDLVYIDSTGTVAKITGTAAASPSAPSVPTNGISVCNVSVAAGATTGTVTYSRGMLARWYNTSIINVKDYGAVGDGVTDDTAAIQAAIDNGSTVVFPKGVYKVTNINLKSNTTIIGGNVTIDGNVKIIGVLGDTVTTSAITATTITSSELNKGDVLYIYKYGYNRETNKVTNVSSGVASLMYELYHCGDSSFTVQKIKTVNNCKVYNLTINGSVIIQYADNINLYNLTVTGIITCGTSIDVSFWGKTNAVFGEEQRMDVYAGSRGIYIENIEVSGGNTVSDNGAIKFNEAFDVNVSKAQIGPALSGTGTFHGLFLDGAFSEDGYSNNPSVNITINNIEVISDVNYYHSIFISLSEKVNIYNVKCKDIYSKYSKKLCIKNGEVKTIYPETTLEDVILESLKITDALYLKQDTIVNNCKIKNLIAIVGAANDCTITNCTIELLSNTSGVPDAQTNYKFIGCDFKSSLSYIGFTNSMMISCSVVGFIDMSACENCYVNAVVTKGDIDFVIKSQNNQNIEGVVMGNGGFTSAKWDVGGNVNENISIIYA